MQSGKMRKQGLSAKRHAGHAAGHGQGRVVAEMDVRVGVFRQPAIRYRSALAWVTAGRPGTHLRGFE